MLAVVTVISLLLLLLLLWLLLLLLLQPVVNLKTPSPSIAVDKNIDSITFTNAKLLDCRCHSFCLVVTVQCYFQGHSSLVNATGVAMDRFKKCDYVFQGVRLVLKQMPLGTYQTAEITNAFNTETIKNCMLLELANASSKNFEV